jgi:hypothetical protein
VNVLTDCIGPGRGDAQHLDDEIKCLTARTREDWRRHHTRADALHRWVLDIIEERSREALGAAGDALAIDRSALGRPAMAPGAAFVPRALAHATPHRNAGGLFRLRFIMPRTRSPQT